VHEPLERQILALDALSKLTRQFSEHPSFEDLLEILLMTLCGQFSIADSFAMLKKPNAQSISRSYFATGKFRRLVLLSTVAVEERDWESALAERRVRRIEELGTAGEATDQMAVLADLGVSLICPLVHDDDFFGIIGLAGRVNGKPYTQEDIDLLDTIINTVTPLVANSYLFWSIAGLNAWYLDVLNNVQQGVFVFDRDFRLRKANSAGLNILRAFRTDSPTLEDVEGKSVAEVFPEPTFAGWATRFVTTRIASEPATPASMVAKVGADERIYNVSITGSVENAEIGTALIVTLDDVTSQKKSEQRLFDLQKLADRGLLASSISHELNNFLSLVLGGVELIEFALQSGDSEKAAATLEKLKGNVANMERFTKGLMDFAKLESTKQGADLNSLISDVLSFLSVQKRFKGIKIESRLNREIPEFALDGDQIAQLMLNLLNNAADAIWEAGTEEGLIIIETGFEGGNAVLTISDNGSGIAQDVRENLFKTHLTTKATGHGYGLVTCARIISNHNGTVEVESEVGKGTTFTVRLPVGAEA
jgi:two-component system NtrC family sensor kinase